jgi:hypothetical protein
MTAKGPISWLTNGAINPASCTRSQSVISCVNHDLLDQIHAELAVQYSSDLWLRQPAVLLLKVLMPVGLWAVEVLSACGLQR